MSVGYGYQRERQGYSVWTLGRSGDKLDCLAFVRTVRDAQRMVDRLYGKGN